MFAEATDIHDSEFPFNRPTGMDTEESKKAYELGKNYVLSGEWREAVCAFQHAINTATDLVQAATSLHKSLLREAALAFYDESYDKAIVLLKTISTLEANTAITWSFLTSALNRTGRHEEALEAAQRVTSLVPTSAEAWYKLGKQHKMLGQNSDAIRAFTQVLSLNDNFSAARREIKYLTIGLRNENLN
jgi:tetratricopeptide (TPR) repeat protein